MNIFVSYSSKSRQVVEILADDLESLGHMVWYDRELTGGHQWWADILDSIRKCELCIFALTPEALDSEACRLEYNYANALRKRILPVMLTDVKTTLLPSMLQSLQWVDYRKQDKQQVFVLNKALSNLPPAELPPDSLPPSPAAPLTPLARLRDHIDSHSLSEDEQKALLFDLKDLLGNPETTDDARQLLKLLRQREDLLAKIEKEIAGLLGPTKAPTRSNQPSGKSRLQALPVPHKPPEAHTFVGHKGPVLAVAYAPSGECIVTGSEDGTALLFNVATGQLLHEFRGHEGSITSVVFSPDSQLIATGGIDGNLYLWDVETGQQCGKCASNIPHIYSVVFSPDGRYLLSGHADRIAHLWDAASGQEIRQFVGHTYSVYSVAFSPDNRLVATGSLDVTIRLWDAETGYELVRFKGHERAVTGLAFSTDGQQLVSASDDRTARLWNLESESGQEVRQFVGHERAVRCIAYSPQGSYILTGSEDLSARLWNINTGQLVRQFNEHTASVTSVAFSPTALYVLTGSKDKTAQLHESGVMG